MVVADVAADGQVQEIARIPTPLHSYQEFSNALLQYSPTDGSAIAISVAGVIHPETGIIKSANIPCISGKALEPELNQALGRHVTVLNDANAFVLAEARHGQAQNQSVVLGIILGTGLGGGIVVDNKILSGFNGSAGEWGHGPACTTRSNEPLPPLQCDCGQPCCLESYGGSVGLLHIYQHLGGQAQTTTELVGQWHAQQPIASKAIDIWLDLVGGALANIINFLDPAIVVVGGGLSNAKGLVDALDAEVGRRRLTTHTAPLLHPAKHGPEQGLIGAAVHANNQS